MTKPPSIKIDWPASLKRALHGVTGQIIGAIE